MVKNIVKKVFIIILLMFIALALISSKNPCLALGDITEGNWATWNPTVSDPGILEDKVESILGVIQVVGIIISVITLSIIGIKFMFGSVEEKANYKQTMMPWMIGAIMIFAITTVPSIIYNVVPSELINNETSANMNKWKYHIAGRDAAVWKAWYTYNTCKNRYSGNSMWTKFEEQLDQSNLRVQSGSDNEYYKEGYEVYTNQLKKYIKEYNYDTTKIEAFFDGYFSAQSDIEKGNITTVEEIVAECKKLSPQKNAYDTARYYRLQIQKRQWEGAVGVDN